MSNATNLRGWFWPFMDARLVAMTDEQFGRVSDLALAADKAIPMRFRLWLAVLSVC